MSRPIKAFVDTKALKANLSCVRQKSAQSQILSVVKANAYGHGIERVFEGLKGSDGFGVLQVGEAEVLRGLGFRGPTAQGYNFGTRFIAWNKLIGSVATKHTKPTEYF